MLEILIELYLSRIKLYKSVFI